MGPLGGIDDCIFDAVLVLVHLRILNWLVVNSPGAMEQKIIPDLHRGIDGDFQISQNVIRWDKVQRQGTGYLLLAVKVSPPFFDSELKLKNSEWIKSPQVGFEPTTNRLTADRSTAELLRNNGRLYLIEFNSCSQPMNNMS